LEYLKTLPLTINKRYAYWKANYKAWHSSIKIGSVYDTFTMHNHLSAGFVFIEIACDSVSNACVYFAVRYTCTARVSDGHCFLYGIGAFDFFITSGMVGAFGELACVSQSGTSCHEAMRLAAASGPVASA